MSMCRSSLSTLRTTADVSKMFLGRTEAASWHAVRLVSAQMCMMHAHRFIALDAANVEQNASQTHQAHT